MSVSKTACRRWPSRQLCATTCRPHNQCLASDTWEQSSHHHTAALIALCRCQQASDSRCMSGFWGSATAALTALSTGLHGTTCRPQRSCVWTMLGCYRQRPRLLLLGNVEQIYCSMLYMLAAGTCHAALWLCPADTQDHPARPVDGVDDGACCALLHSYGCVFDPALNDSRSRRRTPEGGCSKQPRVLAAAEDVQRHLPPEHGGCAAP